MAAIISKRTYVRHHWTIQQRLDHFTDKSGGPNACWTWTGTHIRGGYGQLYWHGRHMAAHRAAWEVANGSIPASMHVCHRCDVPACCNPAHLRLDTHAGNMADKVAKGRQSRDGNRPGMDTPTAKLTDDQVRAIRAMRSTASLRQIARQFGVDFSTISKICLRKTWAHL